MNYALTQAVLTGTLEVITFGGATILGVAAVRSWIKDVLNPDRTLIQLRQQLQDLERKLEEAPEDLRQIGRLRAENALLAQNNQQLERLVSQLQQQVKNQESTLLGLVQEKQELLTQVGDRDRQIVQLTADLQTLEAQAQQRSQDFQELLEEREQILEAMELAQTEREQIAQNYQQLQAQQGGMASRAHSLEEQNRDLVGNIQTREQTILELQENLTALEALLQEEQLRRTEQETQLIQVREQLQILIRQRLNQQSGVRPATIRRWLGS
ncbi:hypothetical protein [Synechococcus elongatus]|uniref:Uncharacterized protein n=1 Tax=Synechococcus elongatus (strain ATCC 33912 / PCC 7942 / FACHB-805) TaxID=1140 RepID=Q31LK0_SYNE7|nr:hypothetical protein [Synechococcus elongatus]ABB58069.1 conserved hypothetical protein [Synechococcus elongatus PCC 7942 = FACHB-805]AJD57454.1 hypothetical protein M744_06205 [Synechococcus elongatus UTEX 2973]MBD2586788.1 hypothetical protein [Synechococcus elongatus FACHB-242]MBD2687858.1 hypothetical protein [Synechococcus elongatus FACHB-1061]MBD2706430.1 hypothetical protein [Synechococcus elongatus PCC 7942 = FACHB-805]